MMDILFKKEVCIKKLYDMHSKKPQIYEKKVKSQENNNKNEVNTIYKRNNRPQRKFTRLIDTIDKILNVFLKEELIELPPIVQPYFPNNVPKTIGMNNFLIIIGHQDT